MTTALRPEQKIAPETEPGPRRWNRDEFYQLAEVGLIRGQRTELIEGELMVYSPQGPTHSGMTDKAADTLRSCGWAGAWVRMQLPIALTNHSEPEPDVSVVVGKREDYRAAHPRTALLLIEISDTTLSYDRGAKASLYAKMGIRDYWIVDVNGDCLEVRRDPRPDPSQPWGHGYASLVKLESGDTVSPLAAPGIRTAVADLLP